MGGFRKPGPLGLDADFWLIDDGTLARTTTPEPGPVGATATTAAARPKAAAPALDPDIEKLDLARTARVAAYALKKAHPSVRFTSGRRNKAEQAPAMASNVVKNRKWIEATYIASILRTKCQQWVDKNPDKQNAGGDSGGTALDIQ
jgi:hypothetical protein